MPITLLMVRLTILCSSIGTPVTRERPRAFSTLNVLRNEQVMFYLSDKVCPTGYIASNVTKTCYKIHKDGLTWTDARSACVREGGDLVSLSLTEKFYEFQSIVRALGTYSSIMITCPCDVYPLILHLYLAKMGYAGVYLFFFFFCSK